MSSVLFLTFLLLEFKLSLLFGFSLLAGLLLALELVFFILLLECLLRLGADARFFKLFMCISLTAFRVIRLMLLLHLDRRGELQSAVVCLNELPDLSIGRLRAEYNLTYRELFAVQILKYAYPERLVKVNRQLCFS